MSDYIFPRFPADPDSPLMEDQDDLLPEGTPSSQSGAARPFSNPGAAPEPPLDLTVAAVLAGENILTAWEKVRRNRGAAGADGQRISEIEKAFPLHWEPVAQAIASGTWQPQPLRRVELPKTGGGIRSLGIPAVLDRVLLQAISQVLTPAWLPCFSPSSYAYQPGRQAMDAVRAAGRYFQESRRAAWQVDIQEFFDSVPHLPLLEKLERHGTSPPLLEIIARSLRAGIFTGYTIAPTPCGIPQGSPLSPLLANLYLNKVDHTLADTHHPFCRYADDLLVFPAPGSSEADTLSLLLESLTREGLRLHPEKTVLRDAGAASFLGYGFWQDAAGQIRRRVAPPALDAALTRLQLLSRPSPEAILPAARRQAMVAFLRGWCTYFRHTEQASDLDLLFAEARRIGQLEPDDYFPQPGSTRPRPGAVDYQGLPHSLPAVANTALASVRCWTGRLLRSGTVRLGMDFSPHGGLLPRPDALRVSILGHTLKFKLRSRK